VWPTSCEMVLATALGASANTKTAGCFDGWRIVFVPRWAGGAAVGRGREKRARKKNKRKKQAPPPSSKKKIKLTPD